MNTLTVGILSGICYANISGGSGGVRFLTCVESMQALRAIHEAGNSTIVKWIREEGTATEYRSSLL